MLSAIDGCKLFSAMAKALGAAIIKATNKLGRDQMKPEQQTLVEQFISGRDVFGILPTGFGKSLCFGCLLLVFDGCWQLKMHR